MKFFEPSVDPAEGLGVLMLFRLIEESVGSFFRPDRPIHITRAPGRMDVLGGRAPGPSSLVLHMPIAEGVCAAIQARDDTLVRLWSPCRDGSRTQLLSMDLGELGLPASPIDDEEARALFLPDLRDRWAGFLLGALLVLARRGLRPSHGAELLLQSDLPEGRGVAASTAMTLAALRAFARLYGLELSADEQAALVFEVERALVAAPSRPADVRALLCAEAGELVALRGPDGAFAGNLVVPMDLEFVGIDSGIAPTGARTGDGDGADDERTERFRVLLGAEPSSALRGELGDLLFAAHAAYGASGRSEPATDLLVEQAKQRRAAGGAVLGAKATGRGGGGTVVLLGERGKVWYEALRIKKALLAATGHSGHIFRWSSPGALSFGAIDLTPRRSPGP